MEQPLSQKPSSEPGLGGKEGQPGHGWGIKSCSVAAEVWEKMCATAAAKSTPIVFIIS